MQQNEQGLNLDVAAIYSALQGRCDSLPGEAELRGALELLFWASLAKDEGRSVMGNFLFAEPEHCPQYQRFQKEDIRLDDTDAIRRLAMAADPDISALAIHRELIWGIALTLPKRSVFITIANPGRLLVRYGELEVLGRVTRGKVTSLVSTSGGSLLSEIQRRHDVEDRVFEFLKEQSRLVRRLGHGGTIVVVPDDAVDSVNEDFEDPLRLKEFERARNWPDRTAAEARYDENPQDLRLRDQVALEQVGRKTKEARLAQSIAQLSATDGAVLVARDLQGLAFAAKIKMTEKPSKVIVHRPMKGEAEGALEKLGNTRHQSAARYAWGRRGSAVLVVSQDGSLSLMSRQGDSLVVSKDFEDLVPTTGANLEFGEYIRFTAVASGSSSASATVFVSRSRLLPLSL